MASIFNDEQRNSLISSMTNPESNASKLIKQNAEIGMSPDLTTEILNKYATYGANTGIGNIGGSRAVDALNENYRISVDAPLKASMGLVVPPVTPVTPSVLPMDQILDLTRLTDLNQVIPAAESVSGPPPNTQVEGPAEGVVTRPEVESLDNAPAIEEFGESLPDAEGVATRPDLGDIEKSKLQKFTKYLENNPLVAKTLVDSTNAVVSTIAKSIVGRDKTQSTLRAPRYRSQASQIRAQPIGMAGGGIASSGVAPAALMNVAQGLGGLLGQMLISPDDTEQIIAAVSPANQPTSQISQQDIGAEEEPIGMDDGGSVLNRKMFLHGGEINGPGGEKEDLVPIWASPNEYVVSAKGVRRMGGGDLQQGIATLDAVNFG